MKEYFFSIETLDLDFVKKLVSTIKKILTTSKSLSQSRNLNFVSTPSSGPKSIYFLLISINSLLTDFTIFLD